jgi:phospholipase C
MNKLLPLALAALCLTTPASAQITSFQHIILVVQENRTPDNLFQGLCTTPTACSTRPSRQQYNIQTTGWLDKDSPTGTTNPHAVSLGIGYDLSHRHSGFVAQCDLNASGACAMDGHAECNPKADPCPPKANYGFVDNSTGAVQPYLDIAKAYGFANYMFSTQQGASYAGHQFLFGATSAPSADDDHNGNFVSDNSGDRLAVGCTALPTTTVPLINAEGVVFEHTYPCFEHATLGDLLNARGVSWRYYGSDVDGAWKDSTASGIWIAPNSIRHICVPVGQQCTGKEWTSHVELTPSAVLSDISTACKLRASWVIPDSFDSDHSWDVRNTGGPSWVASIVNAVGTSPCKNPDGSSYWSSTAIVVTWDEWGGWYDHEPPWIEAYPQGGFQIGFRVPLLVVSAYTPAGFIGNARENFGSIIRLVENNFGIPEGALTFADLRAKSDLGAFFSLGNPPRPFQAINAPLSARYFLTRKPSGLPVDE